MKHLACRVFCLLFLISAAALLCMDAGCSAKVHSGKYGTNAKWYYDTKTKTVTIDCKGKMIWKRGCSGMDWRRWYMKAKRIVFRKGITHIAKDSFYNFRYVEEVILPEGLVSIGCSAFGGITNLKSVRFPSTLRKIGDSAFENTGLETLSLRNVEKVGMCAFMSTKIKRLTIPKGCKDVKHSAFSFAKLKHVKLENGIKAIRWELFCQTDLESVTIPPSVTKIGMHAFYALSPEQSKLKRVTIQSTQIKEWGQEIFGNARKDLVIQVPKSREKEYTRKLRLQGLPKYVKIVGK